MKLDDSYITFLSIKECNDIVVKFINYFNLFNYLHISFYGLIKFLHIQFIKVKEFARIKNAVLSRKFETWKTYESCIIYSIQFWHRKEYEWIINK